MIPSLAGRGTKATSISRILGQFANKTCTGTVCNYCFVNTKARAANCVYMGNRVPSLNKSKSQKTQEIKRGERGEKEREGKKKEKRG